MMTKITITRREQVEVTHIIAECGVRYWEDSTVNGVEGDANCKIPGRSGDTWTLNIEISTGKIENWVAGVTADVHFKVCDEGKYSILSDGSTIATKEGYVPDFMCPKAEGYGDYVIMNIDEGGFIDGWDDIPDLSSFQEGGE